MRTIKFRVWDGKRMTLNGIMFNNSTGELHSNLKGAFGAEDISQLVMQFTGLLDKNGKEIYEGDIITVDKGGNYRMEVRWRKKTAGFYLSGFKNGKQYIASMCRGFNNFEVVGNIYEHEGPDAFERQGL